MGDVADVVDDSELVPAEGNSALPDGAPEAEPPAAAPAGAFGEPPAREPVAHAAEPDSLTGQLAILLPEVVDAGAVPPASDEQAAEPVAPEAAHVMAAAAVGVTSVEPEPASELQPEPVAAEPASAAEPVAESAEAPPGPVVPEAADAPTGPIVSEPAVEPEPIGPEAAVESEPVGPEAAAEVVSEDELPQDLAAVAKGLDEPAAADEAATATEPGEGVEPEAEAAGTSSLDEIEPGTVITTDAESAEAESAQLAVDSGSVPTWPFVVYVLVWLIAAGVGVWEFLQVPAGLAIFENSMYATSIMAGIGLLILGPVLLLIVWAATFFTRENARGGALFVSAFIKGASATLLGAVIWMGALMLIDFLRVGRLL